jgi:cytochrome c biogenesis protein
VSTYNTLRVLGLLDIYHSWWFILLLTLLCLNLLACSIKNFPRTWKRITRSKPILEDNQVKTLPFLATIKIDTSFDEARTRVAQTLKKHFSSPQETYLNGACHLFAEKAKYSRLGIYLTHASVMIILIGSLIGSFFGFKGSVNIIEGETVDRILLSKNFSYYELGFEVRCDDFEVTYYPNGVPKDYKSTLTILEEGEKVFTKTIEVNHPLKYKGIVFYQESYGRAPDQGGEIILSVKKRGSKSAGKLFRVKVGDSFSLPEERLIVKVNRFFNDFAIDDRGIVVNRSSELNNPVCELVIFKEGTVQNRAWVFQKIPDFHGSKVGDYQFIIKGFKMKEYTGLQVTKDPGVGMVWTGCTLMVIGILLTFFFSHRRLWIRIMKVGNKLELMMAGTASKNRLAFEKEFQRLKAKIQESV